MRTRELVESGRYDTREDFTVVVQPFLTHISMPKTQVNKNKALTKSWCSLIFFRSHTGFFLVDVTKQNSGLIIIIFS